MAGPEPTPKTGRRFVLNWGFLGAIADGASAIDLVGLAVRNMEDARQFAREYGYDVDDPAVLRRIGRAHAEAVRFIVDTFLDGRSQLIPPDVAAPDDILRLLVYASRHARQNRQRRLWACAVLKVMHGVFYIDNDLKLRHFDAVRRQVFGGLDAVLRPTADGGCELTDGEMVLPIVRFERKSNKGRHSILLKLLQKSNYVASDVCDRLGVRMVFATRFECLLALQVLQRAHLVSVTNVVSHRTRNNLLDLDAAREMYARYRTRLEASATYPAELFAQIDAEMEADPSRLGAIANPHSDNSYRSVQVTVRKMIHVPARPDAADEQDADFFFDYEIQLLDGASYEQTLHGPASHEAYKQRQIETARLRVLGAELIEWIEQQREACAA